MASHDDYTLTASNFSGVAPLFPLPNLVLFPHVLQPLQIFEPRYRAMLSHSLARDRLIAMALLAPGWETDYEGCPPVYATVCLGRVISHHQLDENRHNVLLLGLRRGEILAELPRCRPFREAQIRLLEECCSPTHIVERGRLHQRLLAAFERLAPSFSEQLQQQREPLVSSEIPLGMLADLIAFTLPFDLAFKQQLLHETSIECRAELLLDRLVAILEGRGAFSEEAAFPPHFSPN